MLKTRFSKAVALASLVAAFSTASHLPHAINGPDSSITDPSGSGTLPAPTPQYEVFYSEGPAGPLERAIETEIRKMDPWVCDLIESDYSREVHDQQVRICRESQASRKRDADAGIIGHAASYIPAVDALKIPEGEDSEGGIDAISHECWHAFFDHEGTRGLIFQDGYHGPTPAEIESFVGVFMEKKGFKDLVKGFKWTTLHFESTALEAKALSMAKAMGPRPVLLSVEMERYVTSHLDLIPLLNEKEKSRARSAMTTIYAAKDEYVGFARLIDSLIARSMSKSIVKSMPEDEGFRIMNERSRAVFTGAERTLRTYKAGITAAKEVYTMFDRASRRRLKASFEKAAADDRKAVSPGAKPPPFGPLPTTSSQAEADLRSFQSERSVRDLRFETTYSPARLGLIDIDSYRADLILKINKEKIDDLVSPGEVMARIVNSLYDIYLGPFEQNSYPLSEDELGFLEGFRWKGARVFGNGIDRYRLALKLRSDGMPVEKIRHDLRGASSFSYKGHGFKAVPVPFTIKGKIPLLIE